MVVSSSKSGYLLAIFLNFYLVVSDAKIQLDKSLGLTKLIQKFISDQKKVSCLDSEVINILVIYIR